MTMDARYYALVYLTVTGEVIGEIPITGLPTWASQVNADGSWTIQTLIGDGGLAKTDLRGLTDSWRFSIAVCWGTGTPGDYICQAGPLISDQLTSEDPPTLQLGGAGFWAVLRGILQVANTWSGVGLAAGADTTYTSSLQGIAVGLLTNAAARQTMPLDIPAAISGTTIRTYFGYDFATAGQRLQELTQEYQGPDILLRPYFADSNHIRHTAMVGNPNLAATGNPVTFDYPGDVLSLLPTRSGVNLATLTVEKGNGTDYGLLWVKAADPTLTNAGWPVREQVDSSLTSSIDLAALQQRANGIQALNGRPVETWTVTVAAGADDAPLGSFDPGGYAFYNVVNHCWIPDGVYQQRILGFTNGKIPGEYVHVLQGAS